MGSEMCIRDRVEKVLGRQEILGFSTPVNSLVSRDFGRLASQLEVLSPFIECRQEGKQIGKWITSENAHSSGDTRFSSTRTKQQSVLLQEIR